MTFFPFYNILKIRSSVKLSDLSVSVVKTIKPLISPVSFEGTTAHPV
jgi:hypothetical protein